MDNDCKNIVEFSIEELQNAFEKKGKVEIEVPTYQRGITWFDSDRIKLLDSIMKKYPFGCLLLYKLKDNRYRIIDGYQRSYTVITFKNEPIRFFKEYAISGKEIDEISELVEENEQNHIKEKLPTLLKNYVEEQEYNTIDNLKQINISEFIATKINTIWPELMNNYSKITKLIKKIIDNYCEKYFYIIKNLRIPAIIFSSSEEDLPIIFDRINSEGKKLTRFQIYAAAWLHEKVVINNPNLQDIIKNVELRYTKFLGDVGELSDYSSDKLLKTNEIDVFDMIYGFGRMICEKFPNLFSNDPPKDPEDYSRIESVGFNLINSCLLQRAADMKNLNLTIRDYVGLDSDSICSFLLNIIDCIEHIDKKLKRGTAFKGNKKQERKPQPLHTELQIISIVASYYIAKYISYEKDDADNFKNIVVNKSCKETWTQYKREKFDSNVLKTYAIDIINSSWRGSGDSKLYKVLKTENYYLDPVPWKDFKGALDNYFVRQKKERNEKTKVANPNNADKLILNLIYCSILSAKEQLDDSEFEIEHLATKEIMKRRIKKYNSIKNAEEIALPISSVGNLCLLKSSLNEQKGKKVIYQFKERVNEQGHTIPVDIKRIERNYSFTKESDFDWLINKQFENISAEEFKQKYDKFLNARFNKMKEKIKKSLFENE